MRVVLRTMRIVTVTNQVTHLSNKTKLLMIRRIILAVFILTYGHISFAATADWESGNQAYAAGNYRLALQHFAAARDDGLNGPAVHYNMSVCNFKLGQFEQARSGFQLIADRYPKMRGLAEYNLGLVARRTDNDVAAVDHFVKAYRQSSQNRKLRILASHRLRELEPELRAASKWTGVLGMRAGYDDNVVLRDETGLPSTLSTESPMADLFASIKGPYNGRNGFRVEGSLYVIRNFDADEFDQAGVYGGAMYDWRRGNWRLQFGAHAGAGSLGDDAFDRKTGANFQAIRYLNPNSELGLSYVYDDVQAADNRFAGIDGSRQQLQARYRWYSGDRRFVLRYRQEENDRLAAEVSPQRKTLSAAYRLRADYGWGYEGSINLRNSRYNEMLVPREEDLLTVRLAVTRTLAQNWVLLLDYRSSSNDSSDPAFSYDRNVITVGAMKEFWR